METTTAEVSELVAEQDGQETSVQTEEAPATEAPATVQTEEATPAAPAKVKKKNTSKAIKAVVDALEGKSTELATVQTEQSEKTEQSEAWGPRPYAENQTIVNTKWELESPEEEEARWELEVLSDVKNVPVGNNYPPVDAKGSVQTHLKYLRDGSLPQGASFEDMHQHSQMCYKMATVYGTIGNLAKWEAGNTWILMKAACDAVKDDAKSQGKKFKDVPAALKWTSYLFSARIPRNTASKYMAYARKYKKEQVLAGVHLGNAKINEDAYDTIDPPQVGAIMRADDKGDNAVVKNKKVQLPKLTCYKVVDASDPRNPKVQILSKGNLAGQVVTFDAVRLSKMTRISDEEVQDPPKQLKAPRKDSRKGSRKGHVLPFPGGKSKHVPPPPPAPETKITIGGCYQVTKDFVSKDKTIPNGTLLCSTREAADAGWWTFTCFSGELAGREFDAPGTEIQPHLGTVGPDYIAVKWSETHREAPDVGISLDLTEAFNLLLQGARIIAKHKEWTELEKAFAKDYLSRVKAPVF